MAENSILLERVLQPSFRCPSNWLLTRIKRVLSAPLAYGILKPDKYDAPDGVPIMRILDIEKGSVDLGRLEMVSPGQSAEYSRTVLEPGDVVVSVVGTIGRSALITSQLRGANVSRALARVRMRPNVNRRFFLFYLQSALFQDQADVVPTGTAQRVLNLGDLAEFPIFLPPQLVQDEVAEYLDSETEKIDALIANKRRLIDLMEERRISMISHAVTKGLDPEAPMRDSGVEWLGCIPGHWAVSRFPRAVEVKEGPGILAVDFVDNGVPLIPVGALSSGTVDLSRCHHLDGLTTELRWSRFRVQKGDLLISTSASVGLTCEVDEACDGAVPYTGVIRLRPRGDLVSQRFVKYVVQSQPFIEQVNLLRTGVAIRHFGPSHLARVNITLPPYREQESIADAVDAFMTQTSRLVGTAERAIAALAEYRSALITAAVTGQIDVREKEMVS